MSATNKYPERGSSLIVVILVMAFMLSVGIALLTITGVAPKVSGSVRSQEEAFNVAEAGFESARIMIEGNLLSGSWTSLSDNCLQTPAGIDVPLQSNYYRKLSDISLLQTLSAGNKGVIFYDQPFVKNADGTNDTSRTYTVFLINQGIASDAMMVCVGVVRAGTQVLASSRLEIDLGIQSGKNP